MSAGAPVPRSGARGTTSRDPHAGPYDATTKPPMLVAIGASAGGPGALATVLSVLPADYRGAIVVLQHVDVQFASSMASWLAGKITLPARVAKEGDPLVPGTVVLATGHDVHLTVTRAGVLRYVRANTAGASTALLKTPPSVPAAVPAYAYAPSIDVFFESVATYWHGPAIGVLLTGMGRDGAQGLRAMRDAGAVTIAQDRASSVVYGMPKAAIELAAAGEVLPITRIGPRLLDIAQSPPRPLREGTL